MRCAAGLQAGPLLRPTPLTTCTDLHSAWFAKHVQGKTRSNSQPPAAHGGGGGGGDAGASEQAGTGAGGDGGVAAGQGTGG